MKVASFPGAVMHPPHPSPFGDRFHRLAHSPRLRAGIGLAAGVWTVAAVSSITSDPGHLGHVLNPVYLLSLALAVAVATHLYVDGRHIGPLRLMALVTVTLALQVALVFAWNLGVFAWLLGRAAWLD